MDAGFFYYKTLSDGGNKNEILVGGNIYMKKIRIKNEWPNPTKKKGKRNSSKNKKYLAIKSERDIYHKNDITKRKQG